MSSLSEMRELWGFFCYTRNSDELTGQLRSAITLELRAQLGRSNRNFRIWQDKAALQEREIETSIQKSVFFIPIITPDFITNRDIEVQFKMFLAREKALERDDLLFPILYMSLPQLEDAAQSSRHDVLRTISSRQYIDFRFLRHWGIESPQGQQLILQFCRTISDALFRPWVVPSDFRMKDASGERDDDISGQIYKLRSLREPKQKGKDFHGSGGLAIDFDVFISYAHQDATAANAACTKLEAEGIRCWIAPRDVPPGSEWAGAIVDAIGRCRAMVLIFSSSANGSRQIRREVQHAFETEKPVLPFRIENVMPEKTLSYYLGSLQWLDALTPPIEQHLQRLVSSVNGFIPSRESLTPTGAIIHKPSVQSASLSPTEQLLYAKLLRDGWILNFNPEIPDGYKKISFNDDGSIREGMNKNESKWQISNDLLAIYREDGSLQNKFRYDETTNKFISINDLNAKGIKDQKIYYSLGMFARLK